VREQTKILDHGKPVMRVVSKGPEVSIETLSGPSGCHAELPAQDIKPT